MRVRFCGLRKSMKKIFHQLDLEIADALCGDLRVHHAIGPSAKINRGGGERFVHWHQEIAGAQDAAFGAQRFLHGFAEGDADIFDRVMLIHIEIAAGFYAKIKPAVPRNQLEHVVEEVDSRGYARLSASSYIHFSADVRLIVFPLSLCRSS